MGLDDDPGPGARLLRAERLRARYSQQRLAEDSTVSVRTLRSMESGEVRHPRRSSIDRVMTALGLLGEARQRFLAAWGLESTGAVRQVDDMVESPDEVVLAAVRGRIDRCAMSYSRLDAVVVNRFIRREDQEKVVVAVTAGVEGTVHVLAHGLDGAEPTLNAIEDCVVTGHETLSGRLSLFELDFGRRLDIGDAHRFRIQVDYGPGSATASRDDQEWSMCGFHRAGQLCVVRVHFERGDRPRRCARVFTDRMRQDDVREWPVEIPESGIAQVVIVEPAAGWHGLHWEW